MKEGRKGDRTGQGRENAKQSEWGVSMPSEE